MKSVRTITIILGIIVLGLVGYYFYTSMQGLTTEEYQFTEGEEIPTNEELQAESELEAEIESQESQEIEVEAEFSELEAMDF